MEQPTEPKKHEKAYYFALRIIGSCDDIEHVKVCRNLIENFWKTYKKDISKKEMDEMVTELQKVLLNKKNSVKFRKHYKKKNGNAS